MLRQIVAVAVIGLACGLSAAVGAEKIQWQSVGLCGGGGLYNPVISPHDPNLMMVESDMGGRYVSRDGGRTWTIIHHKQIRSAVRGAPPLFHPTKPGVIYALSGYGANTIYVTTDNARTWRRWPDDRQPPTGIISRFYIDPAVPEKLFIGTADGKVLFTDDEGRHWRQAKGVSGAVFNILAEAGSPRERRVYFVGTSAGVFRSDDGGATFVRKTNGLPAGKRLTGFAGGSNEAGTILYAATPCWLAGSKLAGGVYVSKDRGETWQRVMNPDIDVSTKRTSRWARGDLPQYSHLVANDADPKRAYVYCGGTSYFPPNHSTIYRTDDAGASWRAVWFVDPRFKQHNVADDWMTSYLHQSYVARPIDMEISPTDPDFVIRSDGMFLFFTRSGGKSWLAGHAIKANDASADKDIVWRHNGLVNTTTWHYYVDPHEPNRHYIAYTDIGFARSLDFGKTWRWWGPRERTAETNEYPIPRRWVNTCYELAFDPEIPGKIWGAFSGHHDIPNENSIWRGTGRSRLPGGVCRSEDFGVTWQALRKGLPEKPALSIVLDPKSPKGKRTLYVAIYDHGVFKSTDDGNTWVKKSKGLGDPTNMRVCRLILHRDGTLFALITGMRIPARGPFTTKGVGLYRSTDGAESWQLVNRDYPLLYPRDFAVDPNDSRLIYIGASDAPGAKWEQGGLHRTTDGGKTWKRVLRKRKTHFGAYFHPKRKGWVYATCCGWSPAPQGSLFLSKDNGKTWVAFEKLPFAQINRVDFDPANPDIIYVTTFGASVWKGPAEP